ncbi:MAG: alpha/beta hydrolase family protein, partial [Acidimicrobiales bacterium]
CVAAATHLAETGAVDPARVVIHGSSAGGFTALAALAFRGGFAGAASYYGVADLQLLAAETHKFESRYLDGLVGPWPEAAATYRERSPLYGADQLTVPVILFQGLEDKVVPPSQAEAMVAALRANGVPFAYVTFATEGHGFRQAGSVIRAIEAELWFFARVLGFQPADKLAPVPVENLDR